MKRKYFFNILILTFIFLEIFALTGRTLATTNALGKWSNNDTLSSNSKVGYSHIDSLIGKCGDGTCNIKETFETCPEDCKKSRPIEIFPVVSVDVGYQLTSYIGQEINFEGKAYAVEGKIIKYEWDFDGV